MIGVQPGRSLSMLCALLISSAAFAQFTGSVQGIVQDSSGAAIPKATVRIVNRDTRVSLTTASDPDGNFRFVSLAPGPYLVVVEAERFAKSESMVTLLTDQDLSVPVALKTAAVREAIAVSSTTPLVDTADSRNQQTLRTSELSQLPLPGRSMIALATLATGVSGLGTMRGAFPAAGEVPAPPPTTTPRKRKRTPVPTARERCRTCGLSMGLT